MSYLPFSGIFPINYQIINPGTPYVAVDTDYIIAAGNSGTPLGTAVVQLPDAPVDGRVYIIFDYQGNISNRDAITITTVSGGTLFGDINAGALSFNIVNPFGGVMIIGSANQGCYYVL